MFETEAIARFALAAALFIGAACAIEEGRRVRCRSGVRDAAVMWLLAAACVAAGLFWVAEAVDAQQRYRRADWPHWVDADGDCQDTRQEVLIEESLLTPTLSADGCRVVAGQWLDVYSGEVYTDPKMLDVDHVVSLSAAHRAGGWRWARDRKRAYANDLSSADHLIAVRGALNRQKGDKGPSRWMPQRAAFRCRYVAIYQAVADRWGLQLPAADRRMIAAAQAGCQER